MSPTESPTPSEPITIQFLSTVLADFAYAQESLNDANSNLDEWAYEVISNMISSLSSDVIITINKVDEGSNTIDYSLQSNSVQSLATAQATISSTSQVQAPGGAAMVVSNTVVAHYRQQIRPQIANKYTNTIAHCYPQPNHQHYHQQIHQHDRSLHRQQIHLQCL
eukprot:1089369_1